MVPTNSSAFLRSAMRNTRKQTSVHVDDGGETKTFGAVSPRARDRITRRIIIYVGFKFD